HGSHSSPALAPVGLGSRYMSPEGCYFKHRRVKSTEGHPLRGYDSRHRPSVRNVQSGGCPNLHGWWLYGPAAILPIFGTASGPDLHHAELLERLLRTHS